jgi:recombination protein RecT
MNAPALAQPLKKKKTIFDLLDAPDTKTKFAHVLSGYITPEKMLRLCINAVRKTPKLIECDPYTVFGAMMTAASLELEPNTVLQQAFLIPYKKSVPRKDDQGNIVKNNGKWVWDEIYECNFQIGYRGFVDLAYRSPRLLKIEAEAIHARDVFEHQKGSDSFLKFVKKLSERGELIGAFCYMKAQGENGATADISAILPLEDIHKIRSRSETYRALTRAVQEAESEKDKTKAAAKLAETPWVLWEDDMAAKSAIKKAVKQFPLTRKMAAAAEVDSAADGGSLDLQAMSDPDLARAVGEGEDTPAVIEHQAAEVVEMVKPVEGEKATVAARKKPPAKQEQVDPTTGEVTEDVAQQNKAPPADGANLSFGEG